MKQILADITPVGSNNLFVTHYWPDKQTDPPLHYHEDYMLCLTLHVRGQRIMDDAVEDFTEKDLVLINPGTPHRFKRDAAYADAKCETATVMFSREMPDWKFLSLEHMRPIREMLLRPAVRWTCPRRRCAATSNAARTRTCGNTSTASASTGPRSSSSRRSSPFRK